MTGKREEATKSGITPTLRDEQPYLTTPGIFQKEPCGLLSESQVSRLMNLWIYLRPYETPLLFTEILLPFFEKHKVTDSHNLKDVILRFLGLG